MLEEHLENNANEMNDQNKKHKWESDVECRDGWGPGFGEGDGSDEYDSQ